MTATIHPHGQVPTWTVGDRLAKARQYAGLDQDQLGEMIGLSRQTISNYERDAVSQRPRAIANWARACEVDSDWIRTGVPPTSGENLCFPPLRGQVEDGGHAAGLPWQSRARHAA